MNKLVLSSKCLSQISPILNDIQVIVVLGISFLMTSKSTALNPDKRDTFLGPVL